MTKTSCNSHADHIQYIKQAAKFLENHRPNHRQNPFKSMIIRFKNSFQQYSQRSQMPKILDISSNSPNATKRFASALKQTTIYLKFRISLTNNTSNVVEHSKSHIRSLKSSDNTIDILDQTIFAIY